MVCGGGCEGRLSVPVGAYLCMSAFLGVWPWLQGYVYRCVSECGCVPACQHAPDLSVHV